MTIHREEIKGLLNLMEAINDGNTLNLAGHIFKLVQQDREQNVYGLTGQFENAFAVVVRDQDHSVEVYLDPDNVEDMMYTWLDANGLEDDERGQMAFDKAVFDPIVDDARRSFPGYNVSASS